MRIVWDMQATTALKDIYDYIKKASLQNAENVVHTIIESASNLDGKIIHQPDKYKKIMTGVIGLIKFTATVFLIESLPTK
jgi:hypothetical protein